MPLSRSGPRDNCPINLTDGTKLSFPCNMTEMGFVVDVNYPDRSATTILAGGSGE